MTIPSSRRHVLLGVTAAGGLTALLVACGGGSGGGATARTSADNASSATQVTAKLTDFHIQLPKDTFPSGRYTFTAQNMGRHLHALEIEGAGGEHRTKTLQPGRSTTLTVTLKPGSYQVYCPVGGHKDLGMKTKISVGRAPAPADRTTSPDHGY
ncbi:plastocyanin/azurin family copper-binding protein [Streptomyces sp. NPDC093094]|uniref:plastocyanin/azurin family copper-binding protein n=1 Tax=Streptomyces sp. NPDC093094 TaxID=3366026 RepID=UPI00381DD613